MSPVPFASPFPPGPGYPAAPGAAYFTPAQPGRYGAALVLSGASSIPAAIALARAEGARRHPAARWTLVAEGFDAGPFPQVFYVQRWQSKPPGPTRTETVAFDFSALVQGSFSPGVPFPAPAPLLTPPSRVGYRRSSFVHFASAPSVWIDEPLWRTTPPGADRAHAYIVRGASSFEEAVRAARGATRQLIERVWPDAELLTEQRDDSRWPPSVYLVARWRVRLAPGPREVIVSQWFDVSEPLVRGSGAVGDAPPTQTPSSDAGATPSSPAPAPTPAPAPASSPTPSTEVQRVLGRNDTLRRVVSGITFLSFGAAAGALVARVAKRSSADEKPAKTKARPTPTRTR